MSTELHTLHRRAGWPSVRELSRALGDGVASPSRIHDAFTKPRLPDWGLLDVLVTALAEKIPRADPAAEAERFYALWDAASDEPLASTESPPVGAERSIPPPPPLRAGPSAVPPSLENERQGKGLDGLAESLAAGGRLTPAQLQNVLRVMLTPEEDSARMAELWSQILGTDEDAAVGRKLPQALLGQGLDITELEEEPDRSVRQARREREASRRSLARGFADALPERVPMPLMDHQPGVADAPGHLGREVPNDPDPTHWEPEKSVNPPWMRKLAEAERLSTADYPHGHNREFRRAMDSVERRLVETSQSLRVAGNSVGTQREQVAQLMREARVLNHEFLSLAVDGDQRNERRSMSVDLIRIWFTLESIRTSLPWVFFNAVRRAQG
ncbi:hypothetical protein [Streptomyces sp. NPDC003863]